jgi:hypothetical protein
MEDHQKLYKIIESHLKNKIGLAIGKIGANELNFLWIYHNKITNKEMTDAYSFNLATGAGVYPNNYEYLVSFMKNNYESIMSQIDIYAKWNQNKEFESNLVSSKNPFHLNVDLKSLEPYYFQESLWTTLLANKKVVIISPFTDSIKTQYNNRNLIWKDSFLPQFTPIYLQFPLSYYLVAETNRSKYPKNSDELLSKFQRELDTLDFDIALIGAGVYGLPLAAHCKKLGKIGFHLGGATQILFGVKGMRWRNQNLEKANYQYWIEPSKSETPEYKNLCEEGCYW